MAGGQTGQILQQTDDGSRHDSSLKATRRLAGAPQKLRRKPMPTPKSGLDPATASHQSPRQTSAISLKLRVYKPSTSEPQHSINGSACWLLSGMGPKRG
jgi:hypothetical protein